MAQYYYLLSSLPSLDFSKGPPLSYVDFISLSAPWLSAYDRIQLESARIDIEQVSSERVTHGMLRHWIRFEHSLRHQLVRIRAENLGLHAEAHLRTQMDEDPTAVPPLSQITEEASPYEAELALLEMRWQFLSHHEVGHYFDLTALIIYGLRLQLLERKGKFQREDGRQILQSMIKVNLDDVGEYGNHTVR